MAPAAAAKRDLPWSERHRPRHLGQVVGNTDQIRKLAEWLRDWDDVVLRGKVKEPAEKKEAWQKFYVAPENINARAVLVSGPPGIGKTTSCCLVARCLARYNLMEFNASDARSKAIIDQMSRSLAGNHTLKVNSKGPGSIERSVIVMDECDGMAGGGDSGGMAALINMIKTTKNPIICICNDRQDRQVRDLAAVCYDLKFRRPESSAVAKRVKAILEGEGKRADVTAIEAVVDACGADIRQVINQTQFFGSVAAQGKQSQKDAQVMVSPFDACTRLLSAGDKVRNPIPIEKKMDLFFIDADFMPIMIQENYLRPLEKRGPGADLARCAQAAELIALGDTMHGHWECMSSHAVLSCIYPAYLTAGPDFARPTFPAWLQKRAPLTKAARTVQELHARIKPFTTCGSRELVTTGYHEVLHRRLLKPLQCGAAKECATALVAYGLTRDFFAEQAPVLRQTLQLEDAYKKVDGKIKVQLLQEVQALTEMHGAAKRKRAGDGAEGAVNVKKRARGGEDERDDAELGDQDNGEDDAANAAKRRKQAKSKPKAKVSNESKASLQSWRPKKAEDEGAQGADGETVRQEKEPLMLLRFIEGHTCAVRRRVHLKDFLSPWITF
mmetsp:Transcript_61151/g.157700  ORF Transcript_61151/g.157700 Transcript_61151/m.157700 type:complete len:612 (-) Transcript_61151:291-2126(-)